MLNSSNHIQIDAKKVVVKASVLKKGARWKKKLDTDLVDFFKNLI